MGAEEIIPVWFASIQVIFAGLSQAEVFPGMSILTLMLIVLALDVLVSRLVDYLRKDSSDDGGNR